MVLHTTHRSRHMLLGHLSVRRRSHSTVRIHLHHFNLRQRMATTWLVSMQIARRIYPSSPCPLLPPHFLLRCSNKSPIPASRHHLRQGFLPSLSRTSIFLLSHQSRPCRIRHIRRHSRRNQMKAQTHMTRGFLRIYHNHLQGQSPDLAL